MSLLFDRSNSEACAASHASALAPPDLPISVTCWVYVEAQPTAGETHTVWWFGRDGIDSQFTKRTVLPDTGNGRPRSSERRNKMKTAGMAVCAGTMALAAPVAAQDVVALSRSETWVLGAACSEAGLDCFMTTGFDLFMSEFTSRDWPLVVIEWYTPLDAGRKERLLPALEAHLDRGGRLLLVYTNLDEWPELQELVGVRTTLDVTSIRGRRIWSVDPAHPTWPGPGGTFVSGFEDFWPDNGDFLNPGMGGYVLATWDLVDGPPAITLTRNGRVMTYGFDLDAFEQSAISDAVANQLIWLLDCHADIDGDGELTFFDFLAFQDLFAAGDPAADFAFDGRLDFFDFLEFQSHFTIGCP